MTTKSSTPSKKASLRIVVASGVNLDLLGRREPGIYGKHTLADLERRLRALAPGLARTFGLSGVELTFFQSNDEARFLETLSEPWAGALINAGAWTHTSLALADRLAALQLPFVEVHISNLSRREDFRQKSYSAPHAVGVCYGFGIDSYAAGLSGLFAHLASRVR